MMEDGNAKARDFRHFVEAKRAAIVAPVAGGGVVPLWSRA